MVEIGGFFYRENIGNILLGKYWEYFCAEYSEYSRKCLGSAVGGTFDGTAYDESAEARLHRHNKPRGQTVAFRNIPKR